MLFIVFSIVRTYCTYIQYLPLPQNHGLVPVEHQGDLIVQGLVGLETPAQETGGKKGFKSALYARRQEAIY